MYLQVLDYFSDIQLIFACKGGDERLRIDRPGDSTIWSLAWCPTR